MRVFVAIDIDEKIRKALGELQKKLADSANIRKGDAKWVGPEAMHLTLKFLGEIEDEKTVEVCNVVKNVASRFKGFELEIKQVGSFGGKSARVLWVGTSEQGDTMRQLQKEIDEKLAGIGKPEQEREFTGHLTLCRIRNPKAGLKLADMVEQYKNFNLGFVDVESISVYQSELTPKGPVYTLLGNYKLQ